MTLNDQKRIRKIYGYNFGVEMKWHFLNCTVYALMIY